MEPTANPEQHPDDLPPPTSAETPLRGRRLGGGLRWALALAAVVLGVMVWVTLTGSDGAEPDRLNNAIAQPGGGTALIGQPLPTVTLAGIDGGTITLGPDLQRPTVINFWASWCPPCVREMPEFEQVYLERDGAVDFVGVNVRDNVVTAQQLAERTGVTYPLVLDGNGEMARTFAVVNMPTTVFVAADGTGTDIHAGALDAASLNDRIDTITGTGPGGTGS